MKLVVEKLLLRTTFSLVNSVVMPGVRFDENSIIGAGSIVTKDIPINSIAVENPAKVIKSKPEQSNP